jgi:hypothetical protein
MPNISSNGSKPPKFVLFQTATASVPLLTAPSACSRFLAPTTFPHTCNNTGLCKYETLTQKTAVTNFIQTFSIRRPLHFFSLFLFLSSQRCPHLISPRRQLQCLDLLPVSPRLGLTRPVVETLPEHDPPRLRETNERAPETAPGTETPAVDMVAKEDLDPLRGTAPQCTPATLGITTAASANVRMTELTMIPRDINRQRFVLRVPVFCLISCRISYILASGRANPHFYRITLSILTSYLLQASSGDAVYGPPRPSASSSAPLVGPAPPPAYSSGSSSYSAPSSSYSSSSYSNGRSGGYGGGYHSQSSSSYGGSSYGGRSSGSSGSSYGSSSYDAAAEAYGGYYGSDFDKPKEEKDIFGKANTGINFSKYQDIQVSVQGQGAARPIEKFAEADFPAQLHSNIKLAQYDVPTPVQKNAIPIIMGGRDLMASAQTGSYF